MRCIVASRIDALWKRLQHTHTPNRSRMDVASLGRGVWPFSVETTTPAVHINLVPHVPSDTVFLLSQHTHWHTHTNKQTEREDQRWALRFLYMYKHTPEYTSGLTSAASFLTVIPFLRHAHTHTPTHNTLALSNLFTVGDCHQGEKDIEGEK